MLSFKKITLEEKELLKHYLKYHKERSCDFTVGVILVWKDFYSIEYSVEDDTLFMKYTSPDGKTFFPFPQGANPINGLNKIDEYCKSHNLPTTFCFVTENDLKIINSYFNHTEAKDERTWSDYLYNSQDIIDLKGKKYRGQRNHINKFHRAYVNYSFEQITQNNKHQALKFFEDISENFDKASIYAQEDQKRAYDVIQDCKAFSMFGAMLKVDDTVIGISYGEILNDTLFVHIERANTKYDGAYQMLVNMFAKTFADGNVHYINREDDSGDPGLRKSKLSYNPVKLIHKYNVKILN